MKRWIIFLVLLSCSVAWADPSSPERYFMWSRNDLRMCPSPICGGFYVRSLNRLLTPCADGNLNPDCQSLHIDFSLLDMTENEQTDFQDAFTKGLGIIKGGLIQTQQNGVSFPILTAYEIWLAQVGQEPGCRLYFSLHDNGIQCITTPCLTVDERLMNWPLKRSIAGVDLYASGADKEKIESAYQVMKTGVVIAAGDHTTVSGPAGVSHAFSADEFYLPIKKAETCGDTVCPAGETCCNASCGICTPPGWACIQMTCD